MHNLYDRNGLMFWTENEIKLRKMFEGFFLNQIDLCLRKLNSAFRVIQCEAPILTPESMISDTYGEDDVFCVGDGLTLRPETTMGSYSAAEEILNPHTKPKVRLPICVWQVGKSFRREQDKVLSHMRLKEFYQQEFQIIFSPETKMDYGSVLHGAVREMITDMIGSCYVDDSDRIPPYSDETKDVVFEKNDMEVCSMSRRTDCSLGKVFEVAIGLDRCVYCFNLSKEQNG